jgi:cysteine sulfinate desulfinase/cysteine desulfurase-like protein
LQKNEIDGTVRISFGVGNTEKDAELLVLKLEEAAKRLGKK